MWMMANVVIVVIQQFVWHLCSLHKTYLTFSYWHWTVVTLEIWFLSWTDSFEGYGSQPQNPLYRTTNMTYGSRSPTVHTMPTTFRARSQQFSVHLLTCGMYRNKGLNTAETKSIVWCLSAPVSLLWNPISSLLSTSYSALDPSCFFPAL
jgi:hypothetical protein